MANANPSPGLLGSLRELLGALLDVGQTRLALASTELEEERLRLVELLLWATLALFLAGIGIVLAALLLVLLFWDGPREWVLGGITAAFLVGAGAALAVWRRKAHDKPPLLAATLAELRRDRDALRRPPP
ncbi:MAG: hypothetical protein ABT20_02110 [Rubrivivax sp. SCN 70-15]|nr:MAG: hypothetical protein ABT20_02110 [Rubrivivax sp. SCN 70-15]